MKTVHVFQLVLLTGCAAEPEVTAVDQAATTVTRITVNGKSAFGFLTNANTNGSITASRDEIANTKSIDFGYATTDPGNPDLVTFYLGAGPIPNSAFQVSHSSAALHVTTSFPVNRCVVNTATGEQNCTTSPPIRFDLTWTGDGVQSSKEFVRRKDVIGPTTIKFEGENKQWSAVVNGTWTGNTAADVAGILLDNENVTVTREITFAP
jgi:hypothetical protein